MGEAPAASELIGEVRDVLFESEDSGYAVIRLDVEGLPLPVTVTGMLYGLVAGARVKVVGGFKDHPRFGRQFTCERHEEERPSSRRGVVGYLSSNFHGIGPTLAEKIYDHFGEDTYRLLDEDPTRLAQVVGIGRKKALALAAQWHDRIAIREAATFLQSFGVTPRQVQRVFTEYGDATVALVRANPFRLADEVKGIGFKTADRIAQSLGMPKDSPDRARAAVLYLLNEATGQGHTLLPEAELLRRAGELAVAEEATRGAIASLAQELALYRFETAPAAPAAQVALAVHEDERPAQRARAWDRSGPVCILPRQFFDEREVAARIAHGAHRAANFEGAVVAVSTAARRAGLELAVEQEAAVVTALTRKVSVITGGPGVGKTTIVKMLTTSLLEREQRVKLAAPTGRAAKRLAEATGCQAQTIHRLLKFDPVRGGFAFGEQDRLELDHLVVDECSMLDVPLAAALLRALPDDARLTLVGDADQLPSVGPGDFFRAVCAAGGIPAVRLTQVFRQREGSRIVQGAHAINRGLVPEFDAPGGGGEFYFVEREDPDTIAETIRTLVVERIPAAYGIDARTEVQVLAPMHKGSAGAERLNEVLGAALNPPPTDSIKKAGRTLRVGDRVVQIKNDYDLEVFNGDQGFVTAVDRMTDKLTARIDGEDKTYEGESIGNLLPAWTTTVHRAQGGEYRAVVIALSQQHYPLLKRNLVYTAITRARQLCVVVGSRRALERAIRNSATSDRYCWLEERLLAEMASGGVREDWAQ